MPQKQFKEWLFDHFIEWEKQQKGRRSNFTKFAEFLGVKQPQLSSWLKGDYKPGTNNIKLLADLFGMEVYDVLDIPRPDPDLYYIQINWSDLKPEHRKALRESAEKYLVNKKGK